MFFTVVVKRCTAGLFLLSLILIAWTGCDSDKSKTTEPELTPLKISTVAHDGCKFFDNFQAADSSYSDQDCLEFSFDGESKLHIKHVNAVFNCCPDSIMADVNLDGKLITITEKESLVSGGCDCLCLYDEVYTIEGLEPGEYTIKVIEPYKSYVEGDPLLQFSVDLRVTPVGLFCVDRTGYPWGINQTPEIGDLDYTGECKASIGESSTASGAQDNCVKYSYDGASVLAVERTNAVFNCCADSFAVDIQMANDTIVVEESEYFVNSGPCFCICPFDLSYNITDLAPGKYTVLVLSPYEANYTPDDTIAFKIDLLAEPSGEYCIDGLYDD